MAIPIHPRKQRSLHEDELPACLSEEVEDPNVDILKY